MTPDQSPERELPPLPQTLIDLIGNYGLARSDGASEPERLHRWQLVLDSIKAYALSARSALPVGQEGSLNMTLDQARALLSLMAGELKDARAALASRPVVQVDEAEPFMEALRRIYAAKTIGDAREIVVRVMGNRILEVEAARSAVVPGEKK